jgi:hypothetical protein
VASRNTDANTNQLTEFNTIYLYTKQNTGAGCNADISDSHKRITILIYLFQITRTGQFLRAKAGL